MWHDPDHEPAFSEYLELDLSDGGAVDRRAQASRRTESCWRKPSPRSASRSPATSAATDGQQGYSKLDEVVEETFPASDPGSP